jgi:hypothetical protein
MKLLLCLILCLPPIPSSAQSSKTITLTVTKVTRKRTATPACDNCGYVTTVEAHTGTANFVLVCESHVFPDRMKNNTVCAQFETGVYEVRRLEPDWIIFWTEKSVDEPGAHHLDYAVIVEEARGKS